MNFVILTQQLHAAHINLLKGELARLPEIKKLKRYNHGSVHYVYGYGDRYSKETTERGAKCKEIYERRQKLQDELDVYLNAWHAAYKDEVPLIEPHMVKRTFAGGILLDRRYFDAAKENVNSRYPDGRKYCYDGIYYRSKSESEIAKLYRELGFETKYETELYFNGYTVYPDFLVYVPEVGGCFYHEHFGGLSEAKYVKDAQIKMSNYLAMGLLDGIDIIYTCERSDVPFCSDSTVADITALVMRRLALP